MLSLVVDTRLEEMFDDEICTVMHPTYLRQQGVNKFDGRGASRFAELD